MKAGKLFKQLRQLKGIKITESLKCQYEQSPQKRAIELMTINRAIQNIYGPYEKALERVVSLKPLEKKHIKKLKKLNKKITEGTGLTAKTRQEVETLVPEIIQRLERNTATKQDIQFIKNEYLPFIEYVKQDEKHRVMAERGVL